jgi:biopolymer transport protein ExbD
MAGSVQQFEDINITPLTDIFLVLLIIMMVVAPMLNTSGLSMANPTVTPNEAVEKEPKLIELVLSKDGQVLLEGKAVGPLTLRNTLREQQKLKPDGLLIKPEPEARHELLMKVIDAATSIGLTKIALQESEASGEAETPAAETTEAVPAA